MDTLLLNCAGFDWDDGNTDKNWVQHRVSNSECEEVFFNRPLIVGDDKRHSASEKSIMKKSKEFPRFKNEEDERKFWGTHDSTDFVDWGQAEILAFPNLRPTMKTISLRLPEFVLDELRAMAQKRDVSYQSLIKIFIKDRIDQERKQSALR